MFSKIYVDVRSFKPRYVYGVGAQSCAGAVLAAHIRVLVTPQVITYIHLVNFRIGFIGYHFGNRGFCVCWVFSNYHCVNLYVID